MHAEVLISGLSCDLVALAGICGSVSGSVSGPVIVVPAVARTDVCKWPMAMLLNHCLECMANI